MLALAVLGTLLAVALFGGGMWLVFPLIGRPVPFIWCVVLGAILAPTDPVSVVAMLRRIGLPAPLQAVFAGESLFNDGVGVVVFTVALGVATGEGTPVGGGALIRVFLLEAVGGGVLGLVLGLLAVQLMRLVRDSHLELVITLALATGTFSLANGLGMSGPIAVVVAGLLLGSRRSLTAITEHGQQDLQLFWSLVDEVLNMILFLLIGLEIIAVAYRPSDILAGAGRHSAVGRRARDQRGAGDGAGAGAPGRAAARAGDADLGRPARRHLRRPCAEPAVQRLPPDAAGGLLRRGGVHHPGAGPDDRAAGAAVLPAAPP